MSSGPALLGLTNRGIFLTECQEPYSEKEFRDANTTNIRSILFSPKGTYFAFRTDKRTEVIQCSDWSTCASIDGAVKDMCFSPMDTYFMVWQMFTIDKDHTQGKPNLHIYYSQNGEHVKSFIQKSQVDWEPKWSSDEKLFAYQMTSRMTIYENASFDRYVNQLQCEKLKTFSLSPSPAPAYYISTFTLGTSGQPSFWRIFKYPDTSTTQALVSKSSFQADKANFYWNRRGTHVLTMTQTEVDKTGGSYYGKQALSYGDVKGNSLNITFNKDGPIHAIAWNPGNWNEWVAVYGHAPAKATLFNTKCEPLFEFGTGSWNTILFPPDGSRVLLGGFGNISTGLIEVWDVRSYKKIGSCSAPDTTSLFWDPRAECFVTATTYPRLTVGNGYKLWHYTCVLIHKRLCEGKETLLSILWQPGNFVKSDFSKTVPKAIEDSTPKYAAAYRPPSARNKPSNFALHVHEKPHKPGESPEAAPSKAAIKAKEKREARKVRKAEERAQNDTLTGDHGDSDVMRTVKPVFVPTGDPEIDKKIKNIHKKLNDIEKLKQQKASGKQLELNQLTKIETETSLLDELSQLKL